MARKKKKKKKIRASSRKRGGTPLGVERLIALAAEPVPAGSGYREYGSGPYCYLKESATDGSVRSFRFRRREDAERAMAEGVAADIPLDPFAA